MVGGFSWRFGALMTVEISEKKLSKCEWVQDSWMLCHVHSHENGRLSSQPIFLFTRRWSSICEWKKNTTCFEVSTCTFLPLVFQIPAKVCRFGYRFGGSIHTSCLVFGSLGFTNFSFTPPEDSRIEPENNGLVQMIFLFQGRILRLHVTGPKSSRECPARFVVVPINEQNIHWWLLWFWS